MLTTVVLGLVLLGGAAAWSVDIASDIIVHMNHVVSVPFSIHDTEFNYDTIRFRWTTVDKDIAKPSGLSLRNGTLNGNINITGVFLGKTTVIFILKLENQTNDSKEISRVSVVREERVIDSVFTASVAILVSILYINYGCAMDWSVCRETLKKPIGPVIGFFCQFLMMPLLSYVIGQTLFPDVPEMQIGMFFTGVSPSGGASNIWTVLLDGNLNLSITMTTMCTIAAFAMMPLWIFTLGRHIFAQGKLTVPYRQIGTFVIGLIIPLVIGFFVQKKLPRVSRVMVRIMKPFSIILIAFIVVFAIVTNLYLFKLFSWKILIAGMGLPWLGFTFGFIAAKLCRQPEADIRAIAIETGIQNTGVAIFLLRFTLDPPDDDLTTVVPVAAAIMTPVPLVIIYIIKLIYQYKQKTKAKLDPIPTLDETN